MKSSITPFVRLILIIAIALGYTAQAQVTLSGKVSEAENRKAVAFANVLLYAPRDTTKVFAGTMTDGKGQYHLETLPLGSYLVRISCVGYESLEQQLRLEQPSSGEVIHRDFSLKTSQTELGEVVVKANKVRQFADHKVIRFTAEQVASASYAKDLLATLPELRIDPKSNQLATMQGGSILVLINGIASTDAQLRTIPPGKVLRVEHYDIPPARYAHVGTVINVITKTLESGYSFGAETLSALTTGFNNSMAYLSLTKGKHRLDLEYSFSYRDYQKVYKDILYEYEILGSKRRDATQGLDPFGYTTHNPTLRYAFVDAGVQTLQVSLMPQYSTYFAGVDTKGTYQLGTSISQIHKLSERRDKTFRPSLDLYYSRKLSERDELSLNLNLNRFRTQRQNEHKEIELPSGQTAYTDAMRLENTKNSLIGEVAYTHKLSWAKLNLGYKIEYSRLNSDVNNLLGHKQYHSTQLKQYAYGELAGARQNLSYNLTLGLTQLSDHNDGYQDKQILLTPRLILGYRINQHHSLRFLATNNLIRPSITMLSSNAIALSRDIIQRGNPSLRSGWSPDVALVHQYNSPRLNLTWGIEVEYKKNPINEYFHREGNKIILSYRNLSHSWAYAGFASFQFKPLGNDLIQIGGFLLPRQHVITTPEGTVSHLSFGNRLTLGLNYKRFSLSYQYVIPDYEIDGAYRYLNENQNDLRLSYKLNRWRFTAGVFFIGMDAHYRTETLPNDLIKYHQERKIRDNNTMVTLGVSYHFQSGKEQAVNRKLNNQDGVAPTF